MEINIKFTGGKTAKPKYLEQNLDSSIALNDNVSPGTYNVSVSIIVDKYGNITIVLPIPSINGILALWIVGRKRY